MATSALKLNPYGNYLIREYWKPLSLNIDAVPCMTE